MSYTPVDSLYEFSNCFLAKIKWQSDLFNLFTTLSYNKIDLLFYIKNIYVIVYVSSKETFVVSI